ncbi:hypothetical protein T11_13368 [Trichinella zimbabwensis]|uniref:Uncharacterized protein n=1 Tax=Trichinella zimbabwensis TaxID=268475 RepID=A0A0V1GH47_9BILA|nr:hypothetical protein T11_13368 [Trichinella zimbabwensis]
MEIMFSLNALMEVTDKRLIQATESQKQLRLSILMNKKEYK